MFRSILMMFATPLGAAINNALAAGAGAAILYGSQKGIDATISTPIVGGLVLAISATISALAATQGITIPVINFSNNGVKVVPDNSPTQAVDAPKK